MSSVSAVSSSQSQAPYSYAPTPGCSSSSTSVSSGAPGTDVLSRRARKRIREAKKKARPELRTKESWREHRYSERFDLGWRHVPDHLERINVHQVSPEEFIRRFEQPYLPAVITGAMDQWPAMQKWTIEVHTEYAVLYF